MTWYVNVYQIGDRQVCGAAWPDRAVADEAAGGSLNGRIFVIRVTPKGPTH